MVPPDWISRDRLWAQLVFNHTTGKTLYYLLKNTIGHSDKIRLISTGLNSSSNTNKYRNTTKAFHSQSWVIGFTRHWHSHQQNRRFLQPPLPTNIRTPQRYSTISLSHWTFTRHRHKSSKEHKVSTTAIYLRQTQSSSHWEKIDFRLSEPFYLATIRETVTQTL